MGASSGLHQDLCRWFSLWFNMHWKPVVCESCSLSDTEQGCSQIEKEAVAIAWACENVSSYILGKANHLETDHKPLVPLLHCSLCPAGKSGTGAGSPGERRHHQAHKILRVGSTHSASEDRWLQPHLL